MNDNPALVKQIVDQLEEIEKLKTELAESKQETTKLCDTLLNVVVARDTALSALRYCYEVQMRKFSVPLMPFEKWGESILAAIEAGEQK